MIAPSTPQSPRSHAERPRVLYCTHRVPYPPDKGDRIRNFHVLRELSKISDVWLACLADEPVVPEQRQALESLCTRVEILPVSGKLRWLRAAGTALVGKSLTQGAFHEPALDALMKRWHAEASFHAALVSASSLAPYLQRNGWQNTPGYVDLVDVDSQKWFDFAEAQRGPKKWLYRFEGARLRKLEKSLTRWAKGITLVSRAETDVYNAFTHPGAATTATNGVDLNYFQPDASVPERKACAFVGALDYLPNIDAAIWFAHDIWPSILAQHPDAEFHVIGRKPTADVLKLNAKPGVKVIGQVPDVRPHVLGASVAVAPIRLARGLQNKVLEALALGKPTVAAPAAIAALNVELGKDLLCPRTPQEWTTAVIGLFENAERRAELGRAGRVFAETHHHWDASLQPLMEMIMSGGRKSAEVTR